MNRIIKFIVAFFIATPVLKADWEIVLSLKNHGTRSEHIQRRVLYKKLPLPFELNHVISPIGEFKVGFIAPGKKGWQITPKRRVILFKGVENIPLKNIKQGWYQAAFDNNLHTSWIYSVTYGYWVDPTKIKDFIGEIEAGNIALPSKKSNFKVSVP